MVGDKLYIADKPTLDRVLEKVDFILANLAVLNNGETAKTKVAENYFNTRRTGKVFGVKFTGTSPAGVRTGDAVHMIAKPSTDTVAERNDFDDYAIFNGLTVNGHVDENGEFVVEQFEGESGFSRTTKDVWVLLGTSWIRRTIVGDTETIEVTDKPRAGFFPLPGAVKSDGSLRPFVAMAKYMASDVGGTWRSVSGAMPNKAKFSHNACITEFRKKGTQYCAWTFQDQFLVETYFQVIFATRNSQSIMQGCTNYDKTVDIAKVEAGATNRVLVTKGQGDSFVVGSCASVGVPKDTSKDRANTESHSIADRRRITAITKDVTVDGTQYDAITLDGVAFTVTSEESKKPFIVTMPWYTGACDGVMGSCGSVGSNSDGRHPFVFCGIEMSVGQYEVMGNAVYKQGADSGEWYVCYDAKSLTATTPTSDSHYKKLSYTFNTGSGAGWKYVTKLGFDSAHPGAMFATEATGTSSTGFCDGNNVNSTSQGEKEVLVGGSLNVGAPAGVWCRSLSSGLGSVRWYLTARLSATGICGEVKA